MIEEWDLRSTNLSRTSQRRYDVAVLPLGAIEPHNRHLPHGMDAMVVEHIARRCSQEAWAKGAQVLCLPVMPYGVDCNMTDFPLAMHVSQATLDAVIRDLILDVRKHGVRKVVLFNGHGGNEFIHTIRQLQADTDIHLFLCEWWKVGLDRYHEVFQAPDDHAGEMETSIAMALFPELVELPKAGDGRPRPYRFKAMEKGWVRTSRVFSRLNDHCAVGNPHAASADKGRKWLDLVCGRISPFLVELAAAPIDSTFPHVPA